MNWKPWAYGLMYAFIGAGAGSAGAMIADPEHFSPFVEGGVRRLAEAFTLPGLFAAFAYLKQSPLPKMEDR